MITLSRDVMTQKKTFTWTKEITTFWRYFRPVRTPLILLLIVKANQWNIVAEEPHRASKGRIVLPWPHWPDDFTTQQTFQQRKPQLAVETLQCLKLLIAIWRLVVLLQWWSITWTFVSSRTYSKITRRYLSSWVLQVLFCARRWETKTHRVTVHKEWRFSSCCSFFWTRKLTPPMVLSLLGDYGGSLGARLLCFGPSV